MQLYSEIRCIINDMNIYLLPYIKQALAGQCLCIAHLKIRQSKISDACRFRILPSTLKTFATNTDIINLVTCVYDEKL